MHDRLVVDVTKRRIIHNIETIYKKFALLLIVQLIVLTGADMHGPAGALAEPWGTGLVRHTHSEWALVRKMSKVVAMLLCFPF